ncbi:MAG: response regulator [Rickettsiales bacterium]
MENKQKTAWVVDDNADIRMPLTDALEFRGFTVREFNSATAAIKALAESKPDIIITDLDTKTKENGIDVIKAATPMGVKSILWTAGSDFHKISINAKNAGAAEVFEKPGNIGKIAARAKELVSNPEREPAAIAR